MQDWCAQQFGVFGMVQHMSCLSCLSVLFFRCNLRLVDLWQPLPAACLLTHLASGRKACTNNNNTIVAADE